MSKADIREKLAEMYKCGTDVVFTFGCVLPLSEMGTVVSFQVMRVGVSSE